MIVVDTSALVAIVLNEPMADACEAILADADDALISAGTLLEAIIVANGCKAGLAMTRLIEGSGIQVVSVTVADAWQASQNYAIWGKGFHSAALNYGDCFAYTLAKARDCPLLYIGKDFAQTDIRSAIG